MKTPSCSKQDSEEEVIEVFVCKVCCAKKCSLDKYTTAICDSCREELTREENLKTIRLILGKSGDKEHSNARVVKKINQKFLNPNFKTDIKFHRLQHELTLEYISIILNTFEFMKGYEGPGGEGISELLEYYGLGKEHVDGIRDFLSDRETQTTDRVMVADFFSKKKSKSSWIYTIFDIKEDEDARDECSEPVSKKSRMMNPLDNIEEKITEMRNMSSYNSNHHEVFAEVRHELENDLPAKDIRYLSETSNKNVYKDFFNRVLKTINDNDEKERRNIYREMSESTLLSPDDFPYMLESWITKIIDQF